MRERWESFTLSCRLSCCFSGDISGLWTVSSLSICYVLPTQASSCLAKHLRTLHGAGHIPRFRCLWVYWLYPEECCRSAELRRHKGNWIAVFRSDFGCFLLDLHSVTRSLWKWCSEKMRAVVRSCQNLSRIPVINVATVCKAKIGCVVLSHVQSRHAG